MFKIIFIEYTRLKWNHAPRTIESSRIAGESLEESNKNFTWNKEVNVAGRGRRPWTCPLWNIELGRHDYSTLVRQCIWRCRHGKVHWNGEEPVHLWVWQETEPEKNKKKDTKKYFRDDRELDVWIKRRQIEVSVENIRTSKRLYDGGERLRDGALWVQSSHPTCTKMKSKIGNDTHTHVRTHTHRVGERQERLNKSAKETDRQKGRERKRGTVTDCQQSTWSMNKSLARACVVFHTSIIQFFVLEVSTSLRR